MGKASYDMTEVRFLVKPDFTECYVFCEAHGDCPIGVQGWHYKVFEKTMPIIEIVPKYITDCVLWPLKAPDGEKDVPLTERQKVLLRRAVELIKAWHNLDPLLHFAQLKVLNAVEKEMSWKLYYDHAPEMQEIRECLEEK